MLQPFFHWFYCLSIADVILLVIVASAGYLVLRQWLENKRFGQPLIALLLLLWFLAVVWYTLLGRESVSDFSASSFIPLHSYYVVLTGGERELLRENFMNVVLFYPAGLLACELLPKHWSRGRRVILIAALFALVSVGIEFCQYRFALGQTETDDVIHNTLGAVIGSLACTISVKGKLSKRKD